MKNNYSPIREQSEETKILLMETNQPLTKLESDALCTKKVGPLLFSTLTACLAEITRAARSHYSLWKEFEDI